MEKKINKIDIGRLSGKFEEVDTQGRQIGGGDNTIRSIRFVAEKVNEIVELINSKNNGQ